MKKPTTRRITADRYSPRASRIGQPGAVQEVCPGCGAILEVESTQPFTVTWDGPLDSDGVYVGTVTCLCDGPITGWRITVNGHVVHNRESPEPQDWWFGFERPIHECRVDGDEAGDRAKLRPTP
jgi:hypothetical protein